MTENKTLASGLGRSWLAKTAFFLLILFGLAAWGLLDAVVMYPARGERVADARLLAYLNAAKDFSRLTPEYVRVTDPGAELERLSANETELLNSSSAEARVEVARLAWLRSLKHMWRLGSAPGRIEDDVEQQRMELDTAAKQAKTQPKPLADWDLAFQWLLVAIGGLGGLWVIINVFRVLPKKYRYETGEHKLTLPDGRSIVPADIEEVDKRKWHKYFVTLRLNDGKTVTLDLYRHSMLESWVLEMEQIRFPEQAEAEKAKGGEDDTGKDESSKDEEQDAPEKTEASAAAENEEPKSQDSGTDSEEAVEPTDEDGDVDKASS